MIRRAFLVFFVFGLLACGDNGVGLEDIAGTYTLRTFNGGELPAFLGGIETSFVEVTAGSITLNEDLTCRVSFTVRRTEDGIATTETSGGVCTYTLDSGSITLTTSDGPLSGLISGSTITIIQFDVGVFVYEK